MTDKLKQARNLAEHYRDAYCDAYCAATSHVYANGEDLTEAERVAYKMALLDKFILPWEKK